MALRVTGEASIALESALAKLELEDADQVVIDDAKGLAGKLDTVADENLLIRYHAHYTRCVAALSKRSDANRARRLAAEEKQREADARVRDRRYSPLVALREKAAADRAGMEAYNKREAARAARLRKQGKTVAQIGEIMKCAPSMVESYLAAHRENVKAKAG